MGKWKQQHPNKHIWTKAEEKFILRNWPTCTNRELANGLGITLTLVRSKCYEMGLKRIELEYWTEKQVEFLTTFYKLIGDTEIAKIFNNNWPKNKPWTEKHIEKKRKYLKLVRTKKQIAAIHQRNVDQGVFLKGTIKRWVTTGQAKEGEIRMWRMNTGNLFPMIKIAGKFIHWNRWAYAKYVGPIPKGMNVCFKDGDVYNTTIENLELLTREQLALRNVASASKILSDNYVAGIMSHGDKNLRSVLLEQKTLIEIKRKQLLLNRTIYVKQENNQSAR